MSNRFPKIQSNIKKEIFNENIESLFSLSSDLQTETGSIN